MADTPNGPLYGAFGPLPPEGAPSPIVPLAFDPTRAQNAPFWVTAIYSAPPDNKLISPTGPTFSDNPWDVVYLNGKPLPGICSVKCQPTIKIDVKKSPGRDGATLTPQGYLPGPIEISTVLWTPPQWVEFQALIPMIWPRHKGPTPKAVARAQRLNKVTDPTKLTATQLSDAQLYLDALIINHPATNACKVYVVVVTGISALEPGPFVQSKIVRIRCIEYQEPGRVAATKVKQRPKDVADAPGVPTLQSPAAPSKGGNGLNGKRASTIDGT